MGCAALHELTHRSWKLELHKNHFRILSTKEASAGLKCTGLPAGVRWQTTSHHARHACYEQHVQHFLIG